jgi:hypothetical protein
MKPENSFHVKLFIPLQNIPEMNDVKTVKLGFKRVKTILGLFPYLRV